MRGLASLCATLSAPLAYAAPAFKTIDLRTHCDRDSYYVVLAARGESSTGHALVVWGIEDSASRRSTIRALGLYPEGSRESDDCASAVRTVPGRLVDEIHTHSIQDISGELIVRVDREDFERSRRVAAAWDCRHQFSLLSRDCVEFLRAIGGSLGIPMPTRPITRWTPPAYMRAVLRGVNEGSAETEDGLFSGSLIAGKPIGRGALLRLDGSASEVLFDGPAYFVLSTTTCPPFMTQRTLLMTTSTSFSGFPSTATTSAK